MPTPATLVRAALLVVAVAACTDDPLSPSERADLRRSRALWESKGGPDYTVEARIGCYCVPHVNFWTRLTVRGGNVVAADPLQALPLGIPADTRGWHTVEEVFEIIQRDRADLVDVAVRFDPTLGYPLQAAFTTDPAIADGDAVYEMRNLTIP